MQETIPLYIGCAGLFQKVPSGTGSNSELQGGAEVDAFDSPFQPAYCSLCMHHGS